MNIYNNPGHNSSIDFFPGLTTIHGISWFGPTCCPWNVCPVLAYAMLRGIYLYVQQCFLHVISIGGIGTQVGLCLIHGGPQ